MHLLNYRNYIMHLLYYAEKGCLYLVLCNYFFLQDFPIYSLMTRVDAHLKCLFPIFLLYFRKLALPRIIVLCIYCDFCFFASAQLWFECLYCCTCLFCSSVVFDSVIRHTNASTLTPKERNVSCMFTIWLTTAIYYWKHIVFRNSNIYFSFCSVHENQNVFFCVKNKASSIMTI